MRCLTSWQFELSSQCVSIKIHIYASFNRFVKFIRLEKCVFPNFVLCCCCFCCCRRNSSCRCGCCIFHCRSLFMLLSIPRKTLMKMDGTSTCAVLCKLSKVSLSFGYTLESFAIQIAQNESEITHIYCNYWQYFPWKINIVRIVESINWTENKSYRENLCRVAIQSVRSLELRLEHKELFDVVLWNWVHLNRFDLFFTMPSVPRSPNEMHREREKQNENER